MTAGLSLEPETLCLILFGNLYAKLEPQGILGGCETCISVHDHHTKARFIITCCSAPHTFPQLEHTSIFPFNLFDFTFYTDSLPVYLTCSTHFSSARASFHSSLLPVRLHLLYHLIACIPHRQLDWSHISKFQLSSKKGEQRIVKVRLNFVHRKRKADNELFQRDNALADVR